MPGRSEDDYTLDDLIAHQRTNVRWLGALFVGAVIYFALQGRPAALPGGPDEDIGPVSTQELPRDH